jgi:PEP-CTERM motif-containing protein
MRADRSVFGTILAGGVCFASGGQASATTVNDFINQAYVDLLHRPADPAALAHFGPLLDDHLLTREQVAYAIDTTNAYYQTLVSGYYLQFLRRPADPVNLSGFTAALAGGATDEQVIATLVGSDEYFENEAGATNGGFLSRAYPDLLHRAADPAALAHFGPLLDDHVLTREQVAYDIDTTNAYYQTLVSGYFPQFLRRPADPVNLSLFTAALAGGATDEQVIATLVGSDEYFSHLPFPANEVPEPSTLALFVVGAVGAALRGRGRLSNPRRQPESAAIL